MRVRVRVVVVVVVMMIDHDRRCATRYVGEARRTPSQPPRSTASGPGLGLRPGPKPGRGLGRGPGRGSGSRRDPLLSEPNVDVDAKRRPTSQPEPRGLQLSRSLVALALSTSNCHRLPCPTSG